MTALTTTARQTIRNAGLTRRAYVRSIGWIGVAEDSWHGDVCGCPDDRCIGYHHDEQDNCECLRVNIEEARRTLCQTPRLGSWDDQRCVHLSDHDGLHRSQDGGSYR